MGIDTPKLPWTPLNAILPLFHQRQVTNGVVILSNPNMKHSLAVNLEAKHAYVVQPTNESSFIRAAFASLFPLGYVFADKWVDFKNDLEVNGRKVEAASF